MRSQELDLNRYDTDKIAHGYMEIYDYVLEPWVGREVTLLELGVHKGGSLLLWRDYFPSGTIVGIDIRIPENFKAERVYLFEANQADTQLLSKVAREVAPDGFDIIIDDASHIGLLTKRSFWHLFDNHLKPGGIYSIEDWGTGYWDDWPDGRSVKSSLLLKLRKRLASKVTFLSRGRLKVPFPCHSYGMVGFVKELIDEQGIADLQRARSRNKPGRESKFSYMIVTPHIVFVKKVPGMYYPPLL